MGIIKELSEDLIKKIAAGEVIERPASVVKELVENSIDAGSTKIQIEIERGGRYIKVSDNGAGICSDDIGLLFTRHASSKIKRFDDLWNINTMGFRGEALASISAVSKVACKSKHINEEYGFELKIIEGEINKKSSAISIGTVFEINDLFYNVPAREKFLKSEATEFGHIYDVILSLALSHPKILFLLSNNKNIVLKTSGSNNLKQAIVELLGRDLQDKLIPVLSKNHFVDLSGFISALEIYRADRKSIFVFVNSRPVKCQIISKAILSAFEGLLPQGQFPAIVLNLNFKPQFVDVNVHPAKKEVRYTHPNDVYNLVLPSIQDAISNHYKKEYKEKSVYLSPSLQFSDTPVLQYTSSPIHRYVDMPASPSRPQDVVTQRSNIFSVNNLQCEIVYSDKPIANMTRVGNKTIFEIGSIFDDNVQIVFSGEIVGDGASQKSFFNCLSDLASEIYKTNYQENNSIQKKIINKTLEEEEFEKYDRKKPPESILYQIWERDNWTCVYCGKQLLDPKVVKKAMPFAKDAFITYINTKGEQITNHILREHMATYDHHLPVSKLPQFNFDPENLFASCIECNRKKSDSMALTSWEPKRQSNWDKPLEIGGLCFTKPDVFTELSASQVIKM